MRTLLPPARPRISESDLRKQIAAAYPNFDQSACPFLIAGRRGYYRDTMGAPGQNDRGSYDDALFLVTPNVFVACNGNTDPSRGRPNMATLVPGVWSVYRFDTHGGSVPHPAICQRAGEVVVFRDGTENVPAGTNDFRGRCLGKGLWRGSFGINIHRGGRVGTSSEGCQTLPPEQWSGFYAVALAEAKRLWPADWRKRTLTYVLLDTPQD